MAICIYILLFSVSNVLAEVVIDNGGPGFSRVGDWPTSSLSPGYYGANYQYNLSGTGADQARWAFSVTAAGFYRVSIWLPATHNARPSNAPYTINYSGISTTIIFDQHVSGGQWYELGTYYFGVEQISVVLTDRANGNPVADAVKLEAINRVESNFTADPLVGITTMPVQFTNLSQGNITSWHWEFGDGHVSNEENPTHTYLEAGEYTVTLTVSLADGSSDIETRTNYITVFEPGAVDLIIDNTDPGFTTQGEWPSSSLTAGYYGGNYQYNIAGSGFDSAGWHFVVPVDDYYSVSVWLPATYSTRPTNALYTINASNEIYTAEIDQHVAGGQWYKLGVYLFNKGEVSVVLTDNANGNPIADAVRIKTDVDVDFVVDATMGLSPMSVQFTDQSRGSISEWLWNFGDGQTSNEINPIHTFLPGLYTVSLTVTGANGISSIVNKANLITVYDEDSIDIVIDNQSPQFSATANWAASTLVPGYYGNNYFWVTGGAGGNCFWSPRLPVSGYYRVMAMWPGPYETRSPNAPYNIHHSAGVSTVRVDQRMNGGSWNELGVYLLSDENNRVELTSDAVGNPVADAVRFVYVGVVDTLKADFTATPIAGDTPLEVSFTDISTGNIETWMWNFGDGNTSTARNPSHIYSQSGVYTVSLTVNGGGGENTKTIPGYIAVGDNPFVAYDFMLPVAESDSFILQVFGNQRLNEYPGLYHAATDFGVYRTDIPVHAIANGWIVSFDGFDGNTIIMRHLLPDGTDIYSAYTHLAERPDTQFTIGQFVSKGAIIGTVGETGWTPSGLHLHIEIRKYQDQVGGYLADLSNHSDPYEFILSRLTYNSGQTNYCIDGTPAGECSDSSPFYCSVGGFLIENSLKCGCATGVPQTDGTCSKTEDGIIIDNDDPEFTSAGDWEASTEILGFYGRDYLYSYPTLEYFEARWTPYFPIAGRYEVFGWWKDKFSIIVPSNRATNAPFTINYSGGSTTIPVDQTNIYKEWKSLGVFYFSEGNSGSVVLSNNANGRVVADAMRFVYIDNVSP